MEDIEGMVFLILIICQIFTARRQTVLENAERSKTKNCKFYLLQSKLTLRKSVFDIFQSNLGHMLT